MKLVFNDLAKRARNFVSYFAFNLRHLQQKKSRKFDSYQQKKHREFYKLKVKKKFEYSIYTN